MQLFKVAKKICSTSDVCRLWLEPADGGPVFDFRAGQFVMLHFLDENGQTEVKRCYSIASAPYESKDQIELGVKAQGVMSNRIYQAKEGDILGVQGPYGVFCLQDESPDLVLMAGGVGATPIRSMARELLHRNPDAKLTLFYSGRTVGDLIYDQEYREMLKLHANFKYVPVVTRECPEGFEGECGRLDRAKVEKHLAGVKNSLSYICGPNEFMDNGKAILADLGMQPKQLRTERY